MLSCGGTHFAHQADVRAIRQVEIRRPFRKGAAAYVSARRLIARRCLRQALALQSRGLLRAGLAICGHSIRAKGEVMVLVIDADLMAGLILKDLAGSIERRAPGHEAGSNGVAPDELIMGWPPEVSGEKHRHRISSLGVESSWCDVGGQPSYAFRWRTPTRDASHYRVHSS
jgi:hypothetical protein